MPRKKITSDQWVHELKTSPVREEKESSEEKPKTDEDNNASQEMITTQGGQGGPITYTSIRDDGEYTEMRSVTFCEYFYSDTSMVTSSHPRGRTR